MAIIAATAFTYLPYWLGFAAPGSAKLAFTTMLQGFGVLTPVALVVVAMIMGWRRRY